MRDNTTKPVRIEITWDELKEITAALRSVGERDRADELVRRFARAEVSR